MTRDKKFYAKIGEKGGNETKRRMLAEDPHFYAKIGQMGSDVAKKKGKAYFSAIARYGKDWKLHFEEVKQEFKRKEGQV